MMLFSQISVVLFFGLVLAGSLNDEGRRELQAHSLLRRQALTPSTGCVDACKVYTYGWVVCTGQLCQCTNSIAKGLADCLNCEMEAGKETLDSASVTLAMHMFFCASMGVHVDPQVLKSNKQRGTTTITQPPKTAGSTYFLPSATTKSTGSSASGGQTRSAGALSMPYLVGVVSTISIAILGLRQ